MHLITLASALLVTSVLAVPSLKDLTPHLEARANKRLGSDNWSGALVHEKGVEYKSVTGELVIPKANFPAGRNKSLSYSSSVWVGFSGYNFAIDGYSSTAKGLLNAGFYYIFNSEGDNGVYPFYEWYPDAAKFFDTDEKVDLKTKEGDKLRLTVTQHSTTTGTVLVENLTKNTKASKDVTAPKNGEIDLSIAEWIISSFTPNEPTDVDFGTLEWSNLAATKADGTTADLRNAYYLEAFGKPEGQYTTSCTVQPPASLTCKWLGSRES